jgi:hypothetical protein
VFRQIKQARGFRQFLLRGFEKVRAEWALVCTAHNLSQTRPKVESARSTAPGSWGSVNRELGATKPRYGPPMPPSACPIRASRDNLDRLLARFHITYHRTETAPINILTIRGTTGVDCRNNTFTQIVRVRLPYSSLAPLSQWKVSNPIRAAVGIYDRRFNLSVKCSWTPTLRSPRTVAPICNTCRKYAAIASLVGQTAFQLDEFW